MAQDTETTKALAEMDGRVRALESRPASFHRHTGLDAPKVEVGDLSGRLIALAPMGEVSYFNTTGTAVAIAAQSDGSTNMVVVNPATTLNNGGGFDNGGSNNGRLRYVLDATRMFHVACTISFAAAGANDTFVFGVAKNGTVIAASKILYKTINAGDTRSTAMHVMAELAKNDYLELYVGNTTDADDLTIKTINLFAMGM